MPKIILAGTVAILALAARGRLNAQACGAASDTAAMILIGEMRRLSGSTEHHDAWARQSLSIPSVDTSTIVMVTQNQTCQKALAAFKTTITDLSPRPTKVYLAKVGTVFVAMHPFSGRHNYPYAVLDSKFKVLSWFGL